MPCHRGARASVSNSTMSVNRMVAKVRSSSASGPSPKIRALANSTVSHAASPTTQASCPGGFRRRRRPRRPARSHRPSRHAGAPRSRIRRGGSGTTPYGRPAQRPSTSASRVPRRIADRRLVEIDDVDPPTREFADLVRAGETLALETGHRSHPRTGVPWLPGVASANGVGAGFRREAPPEAPTRHSTATSMHPRRARTPRSSNTARHPPPHRGRP